MKTVVLGTILALSLVSCGGGGGSSSNGALSGTWELVSAGPGSSDCSFQVASAGPDTLSSLFPVAVNQSGNQVTVTTNNGVRFNGGYDRPDSFITSTSNVLSNLPNSTTCFITDLVRFTDLGNNSATFLLESAFSTCFDGASHPLPDCLAHRSAVVHRR